MTENVQCLSSWVRSVFIHDNLQLCQMSCELHHCVLHFINQICSLPILDMCVLLSPHPLLSLSSPTCHLPPAPTGLFTHSWLFFVTTDFNQDCLCLDISPGDRWARRLVHSCRGCFLRQVLNGLIRLHCLAREPQASACPPLLWGSWHPADWCGSEPQACMADSLLARSNVRLFLRREPAIFIRFPDIPGIDVGTTAYLRNVYLVLRLTIWGGRFPVELCFLHAVVMNSLWD